MGSVTTVIIKKETMKSTVFFGFVLLVFVCDDCHYATSRKDAARSLDQLIKANSSLKESICVL